MQTGCPVQYFSLHGPELCSCSHPASCNFFVVFLASLSYGSAGSVSSFSILNYLPFHRGYWSLLSEAAE